MRKEAFFLVAMLASGLSFPALADGREDYYRAFELEKAGNYYDAIDLLEKVASAGQEFADDALMEAGRIAEEVLLDGRRAVGYYEKLIKDFPSSRLVRRAGVKADSILAVEPKDLKTVLEFRRAVLDFPNDKNAAIAKVRRLIMDNPAWPGADHARYWLGEVYRGMGDRGFAEKEFNTVITKYAGSQWAFKSMRSLGDMAYERKDYTVALEYFNLAAAAPDPPLQAAVKADAERARVHLARNRYALASFALLLLWWAYLLRGVVRSRPGWGRFLKPLPETWLLTALSAVLLVLFAVFQMKYLTSAAVIMAVFLVSIQLSGLVLKSGGPRGAGKIFYFGASALITAFALYGALVQMGVIGAVIHTIKFGPG